MLARVWRLNSPSHFSFVYRRGHKLNSPGVFVWVVKTPMSVQHTKIAVVVSKQVNKKAVVRNLYKRQILAVISQILPTIPIKNYLFVLSVKPDISKLTTKELKISLLTVFSKILNN